MWGDSRDNARILPSIRYIPTRVGRFDRACKTGRARTVHPHACGAIGVAEFDDTIGYGTSPRVWGDFEVRDLVEQDVRYIPTRVGRFLGSLRS